VFILSLSIILTSEPSTIAKVEKIICAYLTHTSVSKKQLATGLEWSIESYVDAYDVFVNMHQQATIPRPMAAATADSATPPLSELQLRKNQILSLNAVRKHAAYEARKAKR